MTLSRIESLILAVGAAMIVGSLAVSLPVGGPPEVIEIVANLMLFGVLFGAVKWGRRGGLIAAIIAASVYILMRIPTLQAVPISPETMIIIGSRLAALGILGVIGGEATTRVKYIMAGLEEDSSIDEWSRVFNEKHVAVELMQSLGRTDRYGEPFSIVIFTLSPSLFAGFSSSRQRSVVRGLADLIRSDLRMVDEVARLNDGRFLVLLPHTPKAGGAVVGDRLGGLTKTKLGAQDRSVTWQVLSTPEDTDALRALHASLAAGPQDDQTS
ncbi:MAG: hypothetical protein U1E26_07370 [Coriobacteriia bacterium]|nr:hypothetical protein [Coriobacteriia bacterium]